MSNGYVFFNPMSLGQGNTIIYQAKSGGESNLCAKVAAKQTIDREAYIGSIVKGPCVLEILKSFDIDQDIVVDGKIQRATIITNFYHEIASDLIYTFDLKNLEDQLISLILCCLSSIYSFAKVNYCHCDIKPNNIAIDGNYKFILIDFGAACKFDELITQQTVGMSFDVLNNACIEYDLSCLAVTVVKLMYKNLDLRFSCWDNLFSRLDEFERKGHHLVSIQMLKMLKVDPRADFKLRHFVPVWKSVYEYADRQRDFVGKFDFLKKVIE